MLGNCSKTVSRLDPPKRWGGPTGEWANGGPPSNAASMRGAVQSVRTSAGASTSPPTGAWPNAGWASPAHSSWPNGSAARGFFGDARFGAVCGTGQGEDFIRDDVPRPAVHRAAVAACGMQISHHGSTGVLATCHRLAAPACSREITRESAFSPVPPRDAPKLNLTMDELSLFIPIGQAITPPAGRNRAETPTTRAPSRAMVRVVVHVLIHATLVAETGWKSGSEPSK